jgi:hypothetical protein
VRLTAWGRAQAAALDVLARAIEAAGHVDVKGAVADAPKSPAVRAAIDDAVATVDPKKVTPARAAYLKRVLGWNGRP